VTDGEGKKKRSAGGKKSLKLSVSFLILLVCNLETHSGPDGSDIVCMAFLNNPNIPNK
jgi:hypothetical protein